MARPVRIRSTYTGDRSKLARLEEAVLKDPRIGEEKRSSVVNAIRGLVGMLMELDIELAKVIRDVDLPASMSKGKGARGRARTPEPVT